MVEKRLRVGSRGSRLARIQAESVVAALGDKGTDAEFVVIETEGDRVRDRPLHEIGAAGLFIKEIETALLEERIDLAVHSMKDLPSETPEGLTLAATTERLDPRDVLVSPRFESLDALPEGARVATGSPRRKAQLLSARPDLRIEGLRGNVPTRLEKLERERFDAIVLAAAGLIRLGLYGPHCHPIPVELMVPAVGQGALGLQTRTGDRDVVQAAQALSHLESERAIASERALLGGLAGGCHVPVGAHARAEGETLRLRAFVGEPSGGARLDLEVRGKTSEPERLGASLARDLLAAGASELIAGARRAHAEPST